MSLESIGRPAPGEAPGVGRWAAIGLLLYVGIGVLSLFAIAAIEGYIFGPFGIEVAAGTVGLSLRNGLHHLVWGLTVALAAAPVGRRLVPAVRFDRRRALLFVVAGALLAGISEFLINEWGRDRFVYFSLRHVGFVGFAPAATLAVALCAWAALNLPRGSRAIMLALLGAATVGLAFTLLPSIPGLADGIDPGSIPLASVLLIDLIFAVLAVAVARR